MNRSVFARYGWVAVLIAVGALWLRVESGVLPGSASAAPNVLKAEDLPLQPTTMGVIDVAAAFKGCKKFSAMMATIKEEIDVFDKHVEESTQEIKDLDDKIAKAPPGSDEEKELRLRLEFETKALQDRVALKKAEFLQTEAETYYEIYEEMQIAVRAVARRRKIDIVLRYNAEPIKREDRNSVLQGINRAVIIFPETNDITGAVVALLNQS
jgi:Skp family chaperone for outer membrane proteins